MLALVNSQVNVQIREHYYCYNHYHVIVIIGITIPISSFFLQIEKVRHSYIGTMYPGITCDEDEGGIVVIRSFFINWLIACLPLNFQT